MPIALEITLILVLLAVAVGLLPLLFQLRQTAKGLNLFLISTQKDLSQIAEDVHASRLRMDNLASSLAVSLGELSIFARSVGEVGNRLNDLQTSFCNTFESATRNVGDIVRGISAVLAFFKSTPTPRTPE